MFKIKDILEVTQGELLRGDLETEVKGISIDSRTIKKRELFIAIRGERFDGHDFIGEAIKKGAGAIIVQNSKFKIQNSKNIPIILVKDTIKSLGDLAKFHRQRFSLPVIAITGSNGKTTTKEMVSHCLGSKFSVLKSEGTKNNKIGVPLTLLKLNSNHDIVVIELGTNHFGEIEYLTRITSPDIGVITNIGPAHLEFLNNLEGVFKEKISLIKGINSNGLGIINGDDRFLQRLIRNRKIFSYGLKRACDLNAKDINFSRRTINFKVSNQDFSLNTIGSFNIYNALAAIFLSLIFGLSLKSISEILKEFEFPEGRLKIKEFKDILILDDTYNSNPLSLKLALEAISKYKGRKILVMGDMLELGSKEEQFHREIAKFVGKANISIFISLGRLSEITALEVKRKNFCKDVFLSNNCDEIKDILKKTLRARDLVLIKGSRKMGMERILESLKV
jgi:UDP-N-acetylmuramoyl-tripeptide--D-alanyl-D-alanine ligase